MIKILFVCLGNICRSPMAESVMNYHIKSKNFQTQFFCDSAGTGHWHVGSEPDTRTLAVGKEFDLEFDHQARIVQSKDFQDFDYIICMDQNNLKDISGMMPAVANAEILLMRKFDPEGSGNVPDPYYGDRKDFIHVYRILSRSCESFLEHLIEEHSLG
jgi:protein-tyrosine-phosphatase